MISTEKESNSEQKENGSRRKSLVATPFQGIPEKEKTEACYQQSVLIMALPKKAIEENNTDARRVEVE